jgi:transcriptional regulator with XRE-family HTH domain
LRAGRIKNTSGDEYMKLGEVLKKERERRELTVAEVASRLGISPAIYLEMEAGNSLAEVWGPRLALIAVKLQVPTSRLIAETGKSAQVKQVKGQCGKLIRLHREKRNLSPRDLAEAIEVPLSQIETIENGESPLETCAPLLLTYSEVIDQPIFNLFYPCGLPVAKLSNYP